MRNKLEQIYVLMSRYGISKVEIIAGDMLVVYKNGKEKLVRDVGDVKISELEGGFC